MSSRLNNLLTHIATKPSDGDEARHLKQRLALATLATQFTMGMDRLKVMALYMIHEMVEGLEGRPSTVRMLPSFVYKSDTTNSSGIFYALDLGGTNFRVLRVCMQGGKVVERLDSKYVIPNSALMGNSDDLFGFIAKSVKMMMSEKAPDDLNKELPMGFTFSFPCELKSISSGVLIKWTKGFSTEGVVGKDVAQLLRESFRKLGVKMNVAAVCNDTIGTLIARYFADENAQVGVIVGTGSNACYFERSAAVTKDPTVAAHGDRMTAINMECGNFDSKYRYVLPITRYDELIDERSLNPDNQLQEKIVSGMYLGEIARHMIVQLSEIGCLTPELGKALSKPMSFETKYMGMITADQGPGLQFTRRLIKKVSGVDLTSASDLRVVREVCRLVRNRSAQQAAVLTSAPLLKTHVQGLATVAVDGSVYEKMPSFQRLYQDNLNAILGKESNAKLVLQKDGSGIGATMITALAVSMK